MGYRSQVHFTIVGKRDEMIAELMAYRLKNDDSRVALDLCYFIDEADGKELVIKFHGDNWKWYDSYPDVIALTNLFAHFRGCLDSESGLNRFTGAFSRLGEGDDDVEHTNFGDDPYDLEPIHRTVDSMYTYDVNALGYKVPEPT